MVKSSTEGGGVVLTITESNSAVITITSALPAETAIITTLSSGALFTFTSSLTTETAILKTLSDGSVITSTSFEPVETVIIETLPSGLTLTSSLPLSEPSEPSETVIFQTLPSGAILTTSISLIETVTLTTLVHGSLITTTSAESTDTVLLTTFSKGTVLATTVPVTQQVTSTMTTLPPGFSIQDFTDFPISGNIWLTTTGSDHSTTIVPVILPCLTCEPQIIWELPEIPWVKFRFPKFPKLPSFHLPCIKLFGHRIAGDCSSKPSGPGSIPTNDDPPENPEPSKPTESTPSSTKTSSVTSSCVTTTTMTNCQVDCAVTNFGDTSTTTTCTSTTCSEIVTCATAASEGSTTTSETTTALCPIRTPYIAWTPADPNALFPTLGIDNQWTLDGVTATSALTTTSASSSGTATASATAPATTNYLSCSTSNEDPDQGVTSAYCVCSGSTLAQSLNTAVTPANSCAYTILPSSTIAAPIHTIKTTRTGVCSVCTLVGTSETCTSLASCTTSAASTKPAASTTSAASTSASPVNVEQGILTCGTRTDQGNVDYFFPLSEAVAYGQELCQSFFESKTVFEPGSTAYGQVIWPPNTLNFIVSAKWESLNDGGCPTLDFTDGTDLNTYDLCQDRLGIPINDCESSFTASRSWS